ncbi:mucin-16-like [Anastrepha ludens]|uniref:mucin-16-like n=1 Tax=Anastrepha ludens TaxID=28586 RepID=UPI0023AF7AD5|nr:mucin-16-like [Anastrepha ludens]
MLAVSALDKPAILTPTELSSLKELSDLALAEVRAHMSEMGHHSLDIIDEEEELSIVHSSKSKECEEKLLHLETGLQNVPEKNVANDTPITLANIVKVSEHENMAEVKQSLQVETQFPPTTPITETPKVAKPEDIHVEAPVLREIVLPIESEKDPPAAQVMKNYKETDLGSGNFPTSSKTSISVTDPGLLTATQPAVESQVLSPSELKVNTVVNDLLFLAETPRNSPDTESEKDTESKAMTEILQSAKVPHIEQEVKTSNEYEPNGVPLSDVPVIFKVSEVQAQPATPCKPETPQYIQIKHTIAVEAGNLPQTQLKNPPKENGGKIVSAAKALTLSKTEPETLTVVEVSVQSVETESTSYYQAQIPILLEIPTESIPESFILQADENKTPPTVEHITPFVTLVPPESTQAEEEETIRQSVTEAIIHQVVETEKEAGVEEISFIEDYKSFVALMLSETTWIEEAKKIPSKDIIPEMLRQSLPEVLPHQPTVLEKEQGVKINYPLEAFVISEAKHTDLDQESPADMLIPSGIITLEMTTQSVSGERPNATSGTPCKGEVPAKAIQMDKAEHTTAASLHIPSELQLLEITKETVLKTFVKETADNSPLEAQVPSETTQTIVGQESIIDLLTPPQIIVPDLPSHSAHSQLRAQKIVGVAETSNVATTDPSVAIKSIEATQTDETKKIPAVTIHISSETILLDIPTKTISKTSINQAREQENAPAHRDYQLSVPVVPSVTQTNLETTISPAKIIAVMPTESVSETLTQEVVEVAKSSYAEALATSVAVESMEATKTGEAENIPAVNIHISAETIPLDIPQSSISVASNNQALENKNAPDHKDHQPSVTFVPLVTETEVEKATSPKNIIAVVPKESVSEALTQETVEVAKSLAAETTAPSVAVGSIEVTQTDEAVKIPIEIIHISPDTIPLDVFKKSVPETTINQPMENENAPDHKDHQHSVTVAPLLTQTSLEKKILPENIIAVVPKESGSEALTQPAVEVVKSSDAETTAPSVAAGSIEAPKIDEAEMIPIENLHISPDTIPLDVLKKSVPETSINQPMENENAPDHKDHQRSVTVETLVTQTYLEKKPLPENITTVVPTESVSEALTQETVEVAESSEIEAPAPSVAVESIEVTQTDEEENIPAVNIHISSETIPLDIQKSSISETSNNQAMESEIAPDHKDHQSFVTVVPSVAGTDLEKTTTLENIIAVVPTESVPEVLTQEVLEVAKSTDAETPAPSIAVESLEATQTSEAENIPAVNPQISSETIPLDIPKSCISETSNNQAMENEKDHQPVVTVVPSVTQPDLEKTTSPENIIAVAPTESVSGVLTQEVVKVAECSDAEAPVPSVAVEFIEATQTDAAENIPAVNIHISSETMPLDIQKSSISETSNNQAMENEKNHQPFETVVPSISQTDLEKTTSPENIIAVALTESVSDAFTQEVVEVAKNSNAEEPAPSVAVESIEVTQTDEAENISAVNTHISSEAIPLDIPNLYISETSNNQAMENEKDHQPFETAVPSVTQTDLEKVASPENIIAVVSTESVSEALTQEVVEVAKSSDAEAPVPPVAVEYIEVTQTGEAEKIAAVNIHISSETILLAILKSCISGTSNTQTMENDKDHRSFEIVVPSVTQTDLEKTTSPENIIAVVPTESVSEALTQEVVKVAKCSDAEAPVPSVAVESIEATQTDAAENIPAVNIHISSETMPLDIQKSSISETSNNQAMENEKNHQPFETVVPSISHTDLEKTTSPENIIAVALTESVSDAFTQEVVEAAKNSDAEAPAPSVAVESIEVTQTDEAENISAVNTHISSEAIPLDIPNLSISETSNNQTMKNEKDHQPSMTVVPSVTQTDLEKTKSPENIIAVVPTASASGAPTQEVVEVAKGADTEAPSAALKSIEVTQTGEAEKNAAFNLHISSETIPLDIPKSAISESSNNHVKENEKNHQPFTTVVPSVTQIDVEKVASSENIIAVVPSGSVTEALTQEVVEVAQSSDAEAAVPSVAVESIEVLVTQTGEAENNSAVNIHISSKTIPLDIPKSSISETFNNLAMENEKDSQPFEPAVPSVTQTDLEKTTSPENIIAVVCTESVSEALTQEVVEVAKGSDAEARSVAVESIEASQTGEAEKIAAVNIHISSETIPLDIPNRSISETSTNQGMENEKDHQPSVTVVPSVSQTDLEKLASPQNIIAVVPTESVSEALSQEVVEVAKSSDAEAPAPPVAVESIEVTQIGVAEKIAAVNIHISSETIPLDIPKSSISETSINQAMEKESGRDSKNHLPSVTVVPSVTQTDVEKVASPENIIAVVSTESVSDALTQEVVEVAKSSDAEAPAPPVAVESIEVTQIGGAEKIAAVNIHISSETIPLDIPKLSISETSNNQAMENENGGDHKDHQPSVTVVPSVTQTDVEKVASPKNIIAVVSTESVSEALTQEVVEVAKGSDAEARSVAVESIEASQTGEAEKIAAVNIHISSETIPLDIPKTSISETPNNQAMENENGRDHKDHQSSVTVVPLVTQTDVEKATSPDNIMAVVPTESASEALIQEVVEVAKSSDAETPAPPVAVESIEVTQIGEAENIAAVNIHISSETIPLDIPKLSISETSNNQAMGNEKDHQPSVTVVPSATQTDVEKVASPENIIAVVHTESVSEDLTQEVVEVAKSSYAEAPAPSVAVESIEATQIGGGEKIAAANIHISSETIPLDILKSCISETSNNQAMENDKDHQPFEIVVRSVTQTDVEKVASPENIISVVPTESVSEDLTQEVVEVAKSSDAETPAPSVAVESLKATQIGEGEKIAAANIHKSSETIPLDIPKSSISETSTNQAMENENGRDHKDHLPSVTVGPSVTQTDVEKVASPKNIISVVPTESVSEDLTQEVVEVAKSSDAETPAQSITVESLKATQIGEGEKIAAANIHISSETIPLDIPKSSISETYTNQAMENEKDHQPSVTVMPSATQTDVEKVASPENIIAVVHTESVSEALTQEVVEVAKSSDAETPAPSVAVESIEAMQIGEAEKIAAFNRHISSETIPLDIPKSSISETSNNQAMENDKDHQPFEIVVRSVTQTDLEKTTSPENIISVVPTESVSEDLTQEVVEVAKSSDAEAPVPTVAVESIEATQIGKAENIAAVNIHISSETIPLDIPKTSISETSNNQAMENENGRDHKDHQPSVTVVPLVTQTDVEKATSPDNIMESVSEALTQEVVEVAKGSDAEARSVAVESIEASQTGEAEKIAAVNIHISSETIPLDIPNRSISEASTNQAMENEKDHQPSVTVVPSVSQTDLEKLASPQNIIAVVPTESASEALIQEVVEVAKSSDAETPAPPVAVESIEVTQIGEAENIAAVNIHISSETIPLDIPKLSISETSTNQAMENEKDHQPSVTVVPSATQTDVEKVASPENIIAVVHTESVSEDLTEEAVEVAKSSDAETPASSVAVESIEATQIGGGEKIAAANIHISSETIPLDILKSCISETSNNQAMENDKDHQPFEIVVRSVTQTDLEKTTSPENIISVVPTESVSEDLTEEAVEVAKSSDAETLASSVAVESIEATQIGEAEKIAAANIHISSETIPLDIPKSSISETSTNQAMENEKDHQPSVTVVPSATQTDVEKVASPENIISVVPTESVSEDLTQEVVEVAKSSDAETPAPSIAVESLKATQIGEGEKIAAANIHKSSETIPLDIPKSSISDTSTNQAMENENGRDHKGHLPSVTVVPSVTQTDVEKVASPKNIISVVPTESVSEDLTQEVVEVAKRSDAETPAPSIAAESLKATQIGEGEKIAAANIHISSETIPLDIPNRSISETSTNQAMENEKDHQPSVTVVPSATQTDVEKVASPENTIAVVHTESVSEALTQEVVEVAKSSDAETPAPPVAVESIEAMQIGEAEKIAAFNRHISSETIPLDIPKSSISETSTNRAIENEKNHQPSVTVVPSVTQTDVEKVASPQNIIALVPTESVSEALSQEVVEVAKSSDAEAPAPPVAVESIEVTQIGEAENIAAVNIHISSETIPLDIPKTSISETSNNQAMENENGRDHKDHLPSVTVVPSVTQTDVENVASPENIIAVVPTESVSEDLTQEVVEIAKSSDAEAPVPTVAVESIEASQIGEAENIAAVNIHISSETIPLDIPKTSISETSNNQAMENENGRDHKDHQPSVTVVPSVTQTDVEKVTSPDNIMAVVPTESASEALIQEVVEVAKSSDAEAPAPPVAVESIEVTQIGEAENIAAVNIHISSETIPLDIPKISISETSNNQAMENEKDHQPSVTVVPSATQTDVEKVASPENIIAVVHTESVSEDLTQEVVEVAKSSDAETPASSVAVESIEATQIGEAEKIAAANIHISSETIPLDIPKSSISETSTNQAMENKKDHQPSVTVMPSVTQTDVEKVASPENIISVVPTESVSEDLTQEVVEVAKSSDAETPAPSVAVESLKATQIGEGEKIAAANIHKSSETIPLDIPKSSISETSTNQAMENENGRDHKDHLPSVTVGPSVTQTDVEKVASPKNIISVVPTESVSEDLTQEVVEVAKSSDAETPAQSITVESLKATQIGEGEKIAAANIHISSETIPLDIPKSCISETYTNQAMENEKDHQPSVTVMPSATQTDVEKVASPENIIAVVHTESVSEALTQEVVEVAKSSDAETPAPSVAVESIEAMQIGEAENIAAFNRHISSETIPLDIPKSSISETSNNQAMENDKDHQPFEIVVRSLTQTDLEKTTSPENIIAVVPTASASGAPTQEVVEVAKGADTEAPSAALKSIEVTQTGEAEKNAAFNLHISSETIPLDIPKTSISETSNNQAMENENGRDHKDHQPSVTVVPLVTQTDVEKATSPDNIMESVSEALTQEVVEVAKGSDAEARSVAVESIEASQTGEAEKIAAVNIHISSETIPLDIPNRSISEASTNQGMENEKDHQPSVTVVPSVSQTDLEKLASPQNIIAVVPTESASEALIQEVVEVAKSSDAEAPAPPVAVESIEVTQIGEAENIAAVNIHISSETIPLDIPKLSISETSNNQAMEKEKDHQPSVTVVPSATQTDVEKVASPENIIAVVHTESVSEDLTQEVVEVAKSSDAEAPAPSVAVESIEATQIGGGEKIAAANIHISSETIPLDILKSCISETSNNQAMENDKDHQPSVTVVPSATQTDIEKVASPENIIAVVHTESVSEALTQEVVEVAKCSDAETPASSVAVESIEATQIGEAEKIAAANIHISSETIPLDIPKSSISETSTNQAMENEKDHQPSVTVVPSATQADVEKVALPENIISVVPTESVSEALTQEVVEVAKSSDAETPAPSITVESLKATQIGEGEKIAAANIHISSETIPLDIPKSSISETSTNRAIENEKNHQPSVTVVPSVTQTDVEKVASPQNIIAVVPTESVSEALIQEVVEVAKSSDAEAPAPPVAVESIEATQTGEAENIAAVNIHISSETIPLDLPKLSISETSHNQAMENDNGRDHKDHLPSVTVVPSVTQTDVEKVASPENIIAVVPTESVSEAHTREVVEVAKSSDAEAPVPPVAVESLEATQTGEAEKIAAVNIHISSETIPLDIPKSFVSETPNNQAMENENGRDHKDHQPSVTDVPSVTQTDLEKTTSPENIIAVVPTESVSEDLTQEVVEVAKSSDAETPASSVAVESMEATQIGEGEKIAAANIHISCETIPLDIPESRISETSTNQAMENEKDHQPSVTVVPSATQTDVEKVASPENIIAVVPTESVSEALIQEVVEVAKGVDAEAPVPPVAVESIGVTQTGEAENIAAVNIHTSSETIPLDIPKLSISETSNNQAMENEKDHRSFEIVVPSVTQTDLEKTTSPENIIAVVPTESVSEALTQEVVEVAKSSDAEAPVPPVAVESIEVTQTGETEKIAAVNILISSETIPLDIPESCISETSNNQAMENEEDHQPFETVVPSGTDLEKAISAYKIVVAVSKGSAVLPKEYVSELLPQQAVETRSSDVKAPATFVAVESSEEVVKQTVENERSSDAESHAAFATTMLSEGIIPEKSTQALLDSLSQDVVEMEKGLSDEVNAFIRKTLTGVEPESDVGVVLPSEIILLEMTSQLSSEVLSKNADGIQKCFDTEAVVVVPSDVTQTKEAESLLSADVLIQPETLFSEKNEEYMPGACEKPKGKDPTREYKAPSVTHPVESRKEAATIGMVETFRQIVEIENVKTQAFSITPPAETVISKTGAIAAAPAVETVETCHGAEKGVAPTDGSQVSHITAKDTHYLPELKSGKTSGAMGIGVSSHGFESPISQSNLSYGATRTAENSYIGSVAEKSNKDIVSSGNFDENLSEAKSLGPNINSDTGGSIAEREYKKWNNAVEMPNNPYAPEALKRRISGSQERFMDLPNISQSTNKNPISLIKTTKSEALAENESRSDIDYKRYSRDYYINDDKVLKTSPKHQIITTDSNCPSLNISDEPTADIAINEEQKTIVVRNGDKASTAATIKLTPETSSEPTLQVTVPLSPTLEDAPRCPISEQAAECETRQPTESTLEANINSSSITVNRTPITPTRGSTPMAFKFLQPKRKLIDPSQILSLDEGADALSIFTANEKAVVEEEVAQVMPSVKALAQAFILSSSKYTIAEKRWKKGVQNMPSVSSKPIFKQEAMQKTEASTSIAEIAEDATIASDLSSLETDPPTNKDLVTVKPIDDLSPITPSPTNSPTSDLATKVEGNKSATNALRRISMLKSNIAFFENLRFK